MRAVFRLFCICIFCVSVHFSEAQTDVQRVRIDFENPEGYTRHLLLGFVSDNSATDGFDYGYDALNMDDFPDDLNWIIEDERYVIQGVGEFNTSKYYPLGMFLTNNGDVTISLNALENFDNEIDVFLYDYFTDTYTLLNETDFNLNLVANMYLDRFYIAFSTTAHLEITNNNLSSTSEKITSNLKVWHSDYDNVLHISGNTNLDETTLAIYNIEGKKLTEDKFSQNSHTLNTSEISNGIYIVKLDSSTKSQSSKVSISN